MAFKLRGFSGFKNVERPTMRTKTKDRGGRREIETISTRVSDSGKNTSDFEEKVITRKRGDKIAKNYDSATGKTTKIKYDKYGNVKKAKTRKTSKKKIEKLAKKSGTTTAKQAREIPTIKQTYKDAAKKRELQARKERMMLHELNKKHN